MSEKNLTLIEPVERQETGEGHVQLDAFDEQVHLNLSGGLKLFQHS